MTPCWDFTDGKLPGVQAKYLANEGEEFFFFLDFYFLNFILANCLLAKSLTKGSEISSVEPIDWRTKKPLTKGSETSIVEPVLHVRRVPAQSPSCNDVNEGHCEVFASLNDRKVQGQRHVRPQNIVGIATLKLLLPRLNVLR